MENRQIAAAAAACLGLGSAAFGQLTFEFTKGPGLLLLEMSDAAKATAIYDGAVAAAAKYSSIFSDPVTLKYTLDYSLSTPPGALAFADSTFSPVPYSSVKGALIGDASSSHDFTSLGGLPMGPSVPLFRNDTADLMFPEKEPFLDPTPGSPNNAMFDMSKSNQKALGMIPGTSGAAGSDAKIVISGATFDFDHTNGIDSDKFDFRGVMLHEIAHAMGFISGTDTMATLLTSPPAVVDGAPMLTVLDLFRYSPLSTSMGARDISLPIPIATGDAAKRYLSIDGGATELSLFASGVDPLGFGFGDGDQGGHFKADLIFALMDPDLALGFNLSLAWDDLLALGLPPDLIALDVIGWTYVVPTPGSAAVLALGLVAIRRRRR